MATDPSQDARKFLSTRLAISDLHIHIQDIGEGYLAIVDLSTAPEKTRLLLQNPRERNKLQEEAQSTLKTTVQLAVSMKDDQSMIESWALASLEKQYHGEFTRVISSVSPNSIVKLWLQPAKSDLDLSPEKKHRIEEMISKSLQPAGFDVESCTIIGHERNQPTDLALLRHIKINQPVSPQALSDSLIAYRIPSIKWLESRIDALRRKGLVCLAGPPLPNGETHYSVTLMGLTALPPQHGRESSDILRAIAISEMKW